MTEETIILRVRVPAPTPAQVHAWLLAHEWEEMPSVDGWRDYKRGVSELSVPQRHGESGFSGAMGTTVAYICHVHDVGPLELHRQITTPAGLVELAAREASHD